MPDQEGNKSGPGFKDTPDQAYKSGRSEDVQEGSLGADTGGPGVQKSRLPEGADEKGSFQSGGFGGQQADDAPSAGVPSIDPAGGDPSPHAQYDTTLQEEADARGGMENVGGGDAGFDQGSVTAGRNESAEEVGQRGYTAQPDYDAKDVESKQDHPKTPSDMGNR